jgi:diacylglycerol kinase family enzyme
MKNQRIDVIATSISGSIKDWSKVKHIIPLFNKSGFENVTLSVLEGHEEVRIKTCQLIREGGRTIISAGGSGTFNSVMEGCCESGVDPAEISLGFLRKGSADVIGKVLGMPDTIVEAINVLAEAIDANRTVKCDVIQAASEKGDTRPRHFVGFSGAELFGEIPKYTENRFIKYYKGILGYFFGDLGPFAVGISLAAFGKSLREIYKGKKHWRIFVDDEEVAENYYQAFVIVNGDLGKDLPFARNVPLGSGDFYLFAIKDLGRIKMIGQIIHTWNASILDNPEKWGFKAYRITKSLILQPDKSPFYVNIDSLIMICEKSVRFQICDRINLFVSLESDSGIKL